MQRNSALDARLNLLQAQVAPHFLFNTLANVQALVETGSPKAPDVLRSLVAYLRAAVPRLNEPVTTLGQELDLVRAYLELMRMRMPDRLSVRTECRRSTLRTALPADDSADAGRERRSARHRSGRGRRRPSPSPSARQAIAARSASPIPASASGNRIADSGPGLAALRERLALVFGDEARLHIRAREPRGVVAEIEFPAREAGA